MSLWDLVIDVFCDDPKRLSRKRPVVKGGPAQSGASIRGPFSASPFIGCNSEDEVHQEFLRLSNHYAIESSMEKVYALLAAVDYVPPTPEARGIREMYHF